MMDGKRKSLTSKSASFHKKKKGDFCGDFAFCFQSQSNKGSTHTLRMAFNKELTTRDEKN